MNDGDDLLSPETRSMLARGRHGHGLSEAQKRGLKRAVLAQAAAGAVIATSATAAAWTTALNAASVAAIALFVGGSIHAAIHRNDPPAHRTVSAQTEAAGPARAERARAVRALPGANGGAAPATETPRPSGERGAWAPAPTPSPVGPSTVVPSPAVTSPSSPEAPAVAAPRVTTAAPGPSPAIAAPAAPAAQPRLTTTMAAASATASIPTVVAPASSASAPPAAALSALQAEARLVREADRALKAGDAEGSLRLLDEHAATFPRGALEPERAAERVLALCAAGRTAEAQRDARAFLASHEAGPLATRVRGSCAASGL